MHPTAFPRERFVADYVQIEHMHMSSVLDADGLHLMVNATKHPADMSDELGVYHPPQAAFSIYLRLVRRIIRSEYRILTRASSSHDP